MMRATLKQRNKLLAGAHHILIGVSEMGLIFSDIRGSTRFGRMPPWPFDHLASSTAPSKRYWETGVIRVTSSFTIFIVKQINSASTALRWEEKGNRKEKESLKRFLNFR
ncbi:hypothetical protein NPIL_703781 [Nephila pilipes]|uniref:Uncharacterized protein n=1 Tax=Nephila pilipes TaxID=299642 RepID=A0A8X6QZS7_NEPPI|nr:hypothetical protein NPIL_703781 [Nephila pilipes]